MSLVGGFLSGAPSAVSLHSSCSDLGPGLPLGHLRHVGARAPTLTQSCTGGGDPHWDGSQQLCETPLPHAFTHLLEQASARLF